MKPTGWVLAILAGIFVLFLASPVWSQERDSDGTRMQARRVVVGSTFQDSLSPPQDRADWRMIRLEEGQVVAIRLEVKTKGAQARLTLTGATGDRIEAGDASAQAASISRKLEAGIYYISVESGQALRYELAIR